MIATWDFGLQAVENASSILGKHENTGNEALLDAIVRGIESVELDPKVSSVGYGGLPTAEGILQLDAAVMLGNGKGGSVLSLQGFPAAIPIARLVLEKSRHPCLCGYGAQKLAEQYGFRSVDNANLLTPYARQRWEQFQKQSDQASNDLCDTVGLICCTYDDVTKESVIGAGCATSGAAFKQDGRVGDSAIFGCGLYAQNGIGAATSTGDGDVIMKYCCAYQIVEEMRHGLGPQRACEVVVARLRSQVPECQAAFVAMNCAGEYGAYSTHQGFSYAIWNEQGVQVHQVNLSESNYPIWKHLC
ncbi:N4-(beta-N-acetylglucosaminyl)-L-asparaginase [Galdieria sulphuraria]|uniref:N4-(Beta-N-acetylglucosaminyl)-L-asparaginase n=1 Tax=Galdieria sulphuraria TaxID=130081 RepID=M2Y888_GALSU|nr:N4-(beta-N-acetylglucosaminyl)-L-asparaginase [Galdieria sulphuraria]EME32054.1 N4-(beta-N-acetylglucosaminyl)-L-asparaginase [Galdieria sulphuraria]|eukprot:XP_005708574.1 N4-(beta-N-acetylglucosaminyl)-L-asparaginase [Galdieria sulphuraria]